LKDNSPDHCSEPRKTHYKSTWLAARHFAQS